MKKRNDFGAVGITILLVPVIAIAAVLYVSSSRVEPMPLEPSKPIIDPNIPEVDGPIAERIEDGKLNIVTSLEDYIDSNAAWCGTFNLIWNDLRDEIAGQDIIFEEQNETVKNLNKGTFTVDELSENSYYKTYGAPTLELKQEIEKAIKKKFNEKSDILDMFDWNGDPSSYFLYCMLMKKFEFPKVFTKLGESTFGEGQTAKYFGINGSTDELVRNQVKVLYYNSENDFAVKLLTKQNDQVIITVGTDRLSFGEIYNSILDKEAEYKGSKYFKDRDQLKVPNIKFDLIESIKDVMNKPFYFSDGREYVISQALQTIKFELDEKGGKIKSEAGMMVDATSIAPVETPRYFYVDESFTIFLIEEGSELPYFAAKISDINNIQK